LRRNDVGGGSKGVGPFGRRTLYGVREGEAASPKKEKASVGRGKAELFSLQGGSVRLNLQDHFIHSQRPLLDESCHYHEYEDAYRVDNFCQIFGHFLVHNIE